MRRRMSNPRAAIRCSATSFRSTHEPATFHSRANRQLGAAQQNSYGALTRMRANNPGHAPTELHAAYYAQRASSGLIIGECTENSPDAYGWADTPGLWSDEQIRGWRRVTDAVHQKGGYMRNSGTQEPC